MSTREPGGVWARYYDSLKLFSPALYSALPGMRFSGVPDRYPRRDDVVDYLRAYAERLPASIRTSTTVASVTRQESVRRVRAEDGREFTAAAAVAPTGDFGTPFLPDTPGRSEFGGRVLHAADYRNPHVFAGQRVIVVGGGNSAIQIAAEFGPFADTTLATPARLHGHPANAGPGTALVAQASPRRRWAVWAVTPSTCFASSPRHSVDTAVGNRCADAWCLGSRRLHGRLLRPSPHGGGSWGMPGEVGAEPRRRISAGWWKW
ncbi:NAD(P)-binding domain-containing protein [Streptomyces sp. MBT58]|uniref:NAD(P)-binding domain-containing protein n=1 Tax=Streptomyces sp. MBT58 TaxID=1488389 RepID=UPI0027DBBE8F|nr:NAD(P)-binding domain-containing protein [Streptomyces sp. MBT58]